MNCREAVDVMGEAVEDRLDPALRDDFAEHMDECVSCGAYYDQLRVTREALRHLPPDEVPEAYRRIIIEAFKAAAKRPQRPE